MPDGPLARGLVGTWELYFREDRTDSGEVHPDPSLGPNPKGILV
jgi:hypothetical protein